MTRGMELNNPANLMQDNILWDGEIRPTADSAGRLAQFDTLGHGLRAGLLNLLNQQRKHGLNTWASIIPKYAPPSENPTQNYCDWMCQETGREADEPFDLTKPLFLALAARAIIRNEQGYVAIPPLAVLAAAKALLSSLSAAV